MTVNEIVADHDIQGWTYEYATLTNGGKRPLEDGYEVERFPQNRRYYCAGFCKTQFSEKLVEHRFVAEIIRAVASYCFFAEVHDEGDYYHTGRLEDAKEAIDEVGKVMDTGDKLL